MNRLKEHSLFGLILAAHVLVSLYANRWGLPSLERSNLVMQESERTEERLRVIADSREKIYQAREEKHFVDVKELVFGSLERKEIWRIIPMEFLMHSFSAYMVRSMDGDEQLVFSTLAQIKPGEMQFKIKGPHYGGMYIYTLGAFLKALEILGCIKLIGDIKHYYQNPSDMADMYSAARFYSAFWGLLVLLAIYLTASRTFGATAALIACLVWLLNPIGIYLSHVVKPHGQASALALGGFACAAVILNGNKKLWPYLLGGILSGMALASAVVIYPALLCVPLAHLWTLPKKDWRSILDKKIIVFCVSAPAVFALANFWLFTDPVFFYQQQTHMSQYFPFSFNPGIWTRFLSQTLSASVGIPVLLSAFAGLYLAFKKNDSSLKFFALYLALYSIWYAAQLSATERYYPARYIVPALCLLVLFSAFAFQEMLKKWRAASAALILFAAYQGTWAYCELKNLEADNPREAVNMRAGRWINENIAPKSSISTHLPSLDLVPPFRFQDYKLYDIPAGTPEKREELPQYFILSMDPVYADIRKNIDRPDLPYAGFEGNYELIESFKAEKCRICEASGYRNIFTSANYPFFIYKRKQ